MSLFEKYLEGWQFRTNTPSFEVGDTVELYVAGLTDGTPVAHVGDSQLFIENADRTLQGTRAIVEVTAFDETEHTGTAKLLERIPDEPRR